MILRRGAAETEVLLVHRPRYDDWTFPKGKAKPGESALACAIREISEETSLIGTPLRELSSTEYVDARGRPKRVRYWLMQPGNGEAREANEVDQVRWATADEARTLLSYARDRALLDDVA